MAERLAGIRPDATFVTMTDVGHYPMLEDPQAFTRAVVAAL
jgi:pimeloyl-ACP methyl ester carboxylesterase